MDETKFWSMIEDAWAAVGVEQSARRAALLEERDDRDDLALSVANDGDAMIAALKGALRSLSRDELLAFDRILERRLYDIDREDVHEVTDGSDDGFLYCRGFIVAAGRSYYEAVHADSRWAVCDAECGEMAYVSFHLFTEIHGEHAWTPSGISRESGSNAAGWG